MRLANAGEAEYFTGQVATGYPDPAVGVGGVGLDAAPEDGVQGFEFLVLLVQVLPNFQCAAMLDDAFQGGQVVRVERCRQAQYAHAAGVAGHVELVRAQQIRADNLGDQLMMQHHL